MGSPTNEALRFTDEAQHGVTINQGFWMGKYLVTQGDYLSVVGTNPSYFTPTHGYSQNLSRPVEDVNWVNATNYCALRTSKERGAGLIPTNYAYRLPTESEWEYACRAGTTTALYLGTDLDSGQANFYGPDEYDSTTGQVSNPNGIYLGTTSQVGNYVTNAWGLNDMIGNVDEWCQDWYGTYPAGSVTNPPGALSGPGRVIRGGDWGATGQYCRSAARSYLNPANTNNYVGYYIGFRVVLATQ